MRKAIIHAVPQSGERIAASLRGLHRARPCQPIGFAIDRRDVHGFDAKGDALTLSAHSSIEGLTRT